MVTDRFRNDSLGPAKQTERSDEITSDRMGGSIQEVGQSADGDIGIHLSMGTYNDWIENHLQADNAANEASETWSTPITLAGVDAVGTTNRFTTPAAGGEFEPLRVGQWVRTKGFVNAGNNGFHKITAIISADSIECSGSTLVTEDGAGLSNLYAKMARNGVNCIPFTVEKSFLDIDKHLLLVGALVNTFNLNVRSRALIEGTMGIIAKSSVSAGAEVGTSYSAPTTTSVCTATANVVKMFEGGSALNIFVQSLAFQTTNNQAAQDAIANKFAIGVRSGNFEANGSLSAYLANMTLYDKLVNHTATSLGIIISDNQASPHLGNAMIITIPRVYYSAGGVPVEGVNRTVMANLDWQAEKDLTTGCIAQFDYFIA